MLFGKKTGLTSNVIEILPVPVYKTMSEEEQDAIQYALSILKQKFTFVTHILPKDIKMESLSYQLASYLKTQGNLKAQFVVLVVWDKTGLTELKSTIPIRVLEVKSHQENPQKLSKEIDKFAQSLVNEVLEKTGGGGFLEAKKIEFINPFVADKMDYIRSEVTRMLRNITVDDLLERRGIILSYTKFDTDFYEEVLDELKELEDTPIWIILVDYDREEIVRKIARNLIIAGRIIAFARNAEDLMLYLQNYPVAVITYPSEETFHKFNNEMKKQFDTTIPFDRVVAISVEK